MSQPSQQVGPNVELAPQLAPQVGPGPLAQARTSGVDDILDEIDQVLETNAVAFVEGFVQKGGQ